MQRLFITVANAFFKCEASFISTKIPAYAGMKSRSALFPPSPFSLEKSSYIE